MARDKLDQETNIIKLVQFNRYFSAALKLLIGRKQRKRLRRKTRQWLIDPDAEAKTDTSEDEGSDSSLDLNALMDISEQRNVGMSSFRTNDRN